MTYFSADNKIKTAQLFVHNLLWGLVEIDSDKFRSAEEGRQLSEELAHKIIRWDNEVLCPDNDSHFVDKTADWIYEYIIKGRTCGAIKGQMRDKRYEERIQELEEELRKSNKDKIKLNRKYLQTREHNLMLANELRDREQQIRTYENQFYRLDSNLSRCPSCGSNIIAEEIDIHQCKRRVVDYRIVDDIL
jgi:hypothetical protein